MELKLKISKEIEDKFQDQLAQQIGQNVWGARISEETKYYSFFIKMHGSDWHFELYKKPNNKNWYKLCCSEVEFHLPIGYIKDMKAFCQQIARIRLEKLSRVNK